MSAIAAFFSRKKKDGEQTPRSFVPEDLEGSKEKKNSINASPRVHVPELIESPKSKPRAVSPPLPAQAARENAARASSPSKGRALSPPLPSQAISPSKASRAGKGVSSKPQNASAHTPSSPRQTAPDIDPSLTDLINSYKAPLRQLFAAYRSTDAGFCSSDILNLCIELKLTPERHEDKPRFSEAHAESEIVYLTNEEINSHFTHCLDGDALGGKNTPVLGFDAFINCLVRLAACLGERSGEDWESQEALFRHFLTEIAGLEPISRRGPKGKTKQLVDYHLSPRALDDEVVRLFQESEGKTHLDSTFYRITIPAVLTVADRRETESVDPFPSQLCQHSLNAQLSPRVIVNGNGGREPSNNSPPRSTTLDLHEQAIADVIEHASAKRGRGRGWGRGGRGARGRRGRGDAAASAADDSAKNRFLNMISQAKESETESDAKRKEREALRQKQDRMRAKEKEREAKSLNASAPLPERPAAQDDFQVLLRRNKGDKNKEHESGIPAGPRRARIDAAGGDSDSVSSRRESNFDREPSLPSKSALARRNSESRVSVGGADNSKRVSGRASSPALEKSPASKNLRGNVPPRRSSDGGGGYAPPAGRESPYKESPAPAPVRKRKGGGYASMAGLDTQRDVGSAVARPAKPREDFAEDEEKRTRALEAELYHADQSLQNLRDRKQYTVVGAKPPLHSKMRQPQLDLTEKEERLLSMLDRRQNQAQKVVSMPKSNPAPVLPAFRRPR